MNFPHECWLLFYVVSWPIGMFVEVGLAKMALCGCVTLPMFIINLKLPFIHDVCSFWASS